jgi:S-adenosylmethionine/arginine decarboxylase-like enzyme
MAHVQLLVRAEIRRPLLICSAARQFLRDAVALAGMNIIAGPHAVMGAMPGNEGVSATAVLDYSSVALHEWPYRERPLLQFDIYTCGPVEPTVALYRPLFADLEPISLAAMSIDMDTMTVRYIKREGDVRDPLCEDEHWLPNSSDGR